MVRRGGKHQTSEGRAASNTRRIIREGARESKKNTANMKLWVRPLAYIENYQILVLDFDVS